MAHLCLQAVPVTLLRRFNLEEEEAQEDRSPAPPSKADSKVICQNCLTGISKTGKRLTCNVGTPHVVHQRCYSVKDKRCKSCAARKQ